MKISTNNLAGGSLIVVMGVLATLMVVVAVAAEYSSSVTRGVQRSNSYETAVVTGDSCIEVLFSEWRKTCRNPQNALVKTSDLSAVATPAPTLFPNLAGAGITSPFVKRGTSIDPTQDVDYDPSYTISNYKVIGVTPEWGALAASTTAPIPAVGQSTGSATTAGLTWSYIASADVTLPALGPNGNVVARVRRVFQKQQLSPWNFAIFYADPLEIHPGPQFTVTGWVHTNSDLYTAHDSLTFADKVTYAGDWNVSFKPGDQQHLNDAIGKPSYPGNLPPARDQALQPFGLDSTSIFSTTDTNPNNDSYRELIDLPSRAFNPSSAYTDPLASARYWNQAAVAIQVSDNPSSSTPGWDGVKGHDLVKLYITDPSTGAATQITSGSKAPYNDLYNMFADKGVITTNQSIQDNREGATVKVASLDVSKIVSGGGSNPTYTHPASGFSSNPIVYMYNASATSSARRGIRVQNAAKIPSNGITIASNNPVYLQGDFNTGGNGSDNKNVPSNSSNYLNSDGTYKDPSTPPDPQVAGYTRAPCSVLADAVNILSNSWSDANSGTMPAASATTINAAIVSGIVPTSPVGGDGAYSGGAENFPRFLENWGNRTLTYYGSMVELYKSQQAIGEWGKSNVYGAPTRAWYFDPNFKVTPPPGSIMLYSYTKGRWSLN